jgi:S-DNA-T family DNA segregation ATPase FtsK/SpoIIIE
LTSGLVTLRSWKNVWASSITTTTSCQVVISFATRTVDGAVAALGEEIRQHPDASPVQLNDPVYVGVAVTSLPGRPGFHRVRTPQVDHHQIAAIIRATAELRADPAALLAQATPGLRAVPRMPAPGDVA